MKDPPAPHPRKLAAGLCSGAASYRAAMSTTHEVTNQVPPLIGHDPIAGDAALAEACTRHADAATLESLAGLGRLAHVRCIRWDIRLEDAG